MDSWGGRLTWFDCNGKNKNWNELPTHIADRSKLICKVRHNENCDLYLDFCSHFEADGSNCSLWKISAVE